MVGGALNVAGASLPGIPLVLIGHNERIAWGVTASFADVQDHYVEVLNPENPNQYAAGDVWEDLQVFSDTISVANGNPVQLETRRTRHGVVVSDEPRDGKVLALRWDGLWNGDNALGFLLLNQASNWLDFTEALRWIGSFPLAFVYADVEGNIGYFPSGDIPIRSGFDGTIPVDGGSGAFEWQGFIPHEMKPALLNPEEGYIISANQNMVPDDVESEYTLGRDQLAPFRANRIASLLTSTQLRPADFTHIQSDRYDSSTESILSHLMHVDTESEEANKAQDYLRSWNGQMSAGPAPAIYQAFYVRLIDNTFRDELGDELFSEFLEFLELGYPGAIFSIIEDPSSAWWDDRDTPAVEDRSAIYQRSFNEALDLLSTRQGTSPDGWDWAALHGIVFEHPLGQEPPLNWIFNRGPIPFGGSAFTIANAIVSLAQPFQASAGTSFRIVVDLSDMNACTSTVPTGASGHPMSSHYFDQNQDWLTGVGHPLLFDRGSIEATLEGKLTLTP
jgi:penicillin amidase